jgi:hypothetical protein
MIAKAASLDFGAIGKISARFEGCDRCPYWLIPKPGLIRVEVYA